MTSEVFRSKRKATQPFEGDIDVFLDEENDGQQKYLDFIELLRKHFAEKIEGLSSLQRTKMDTGVTKVILKSGNLRVACIFRNSDLYIIGFMTGLESSEQTFWVDDDEYYLFKENKLTEKDAKRKQNIKEVIGVNTAIETLSIPLSYQKILNPKNYTLRFSEMGNSLTKLSQMKKNLSYSEQEKIRKHIAPFVVAFAEAIRFEIIAQVVAETISKGTGELNMNSKVSFAEYSYFEECKYLDLVQNWAVFSGIAKACIEDKKKLQSMIKCGGVQVSFECKNLEKVLSVASGSKFERSRRSVESIDWLSEKLPESSKFSALGSVKKMDQFSASSNRNLDLMGGLQLLALGVLYLTSRKLAPLDLDNQLDSFEAQAIAADLVQRINCVAGLSLGYERDIHMQKVLALELARGGNVANRMAQLVEEQFADRADEPELVEVAKNAMSYELARWDFQLGKEYERFGRNCF